MRFANLAAVPANRDATAGKEQPQIIDDFGRGADRGPGVARPRPATDGDGGREVADKLRVGLIKAFEELAHIGRKALEITPLGFRVKGVEYQAAFARSADAADR